MMGHLWEVGSAPPPSREWTCPHCHHANGPGRMALQQTRERESHPEQKVEDVHPPGMIWAMVPLIGVAEVAGVQEEGPQAREEEGHHSEARRGGAVGADSAAGLPPSFSSSFDNTQSVLGCDWSTDDRDSVAVRYCRYLCSVCISFIPLYLLVCIEFLCFCVFTSATEMDNKNPHIKLLA